jgi:hypothetical protein
VFAPLIVIPQARIAARSSDTSALRRAQAYRHDQDIEQLQTSQRAAQTPGFLDNELAAAWDFSKIPLYPQGRRSLSEQPSPTPTRFPIQAKLRIGAVNDPLEHEADRVADQVMRMPAERVSLQTHARTGVQRQCACEGTCRKCLEAKAGDADSMVRRAAGVCVAARAIDAPPKVHRALRAPGQALDDSTRAFMEPRFRRDFGHIRVHADAEAAESARDVGARAFAVGRHIVFGNGEGSFATGAGLRLLAHELAHTVQQEGAGSLTDSLLLRAPLKLDRLTVEQLVARAEEIFRKAGTAYLKATPRRMTLGQLKGEFTVGVLQGVKDGKIVTLVGGNDPKFEPYLERAVEPGERIVPSVTLTAHNLRTDLPKKTGHAHAEPPLSQTAEAEGLTDSLLASSNLGCVDCVSQMAEHSPGVTHVNPKVTSRGSITPPESIARPVTTTAVDSDPAQRYRGGRTPPREVGRSTVTSGEITAVDKSVATGAGDIAESVIVDETALYAGTGGLKAVLADLATGLEVLALIDTLKMLIELSYAWLTYEKGGAGSEGAAVAHVTTLLQKNDPDIQAAFKAHASEAEKITRDHPELNVYANVELVTMETWKTRQDHLGAEGDPYDRELSDITFKNLAVSIFPSRKQKVLWDRKSSFSQAVADGFTQHVRYTLMTYPVEITFGETPQQRQQRTFAHEIVEAAKKHQSARMVAGSHLGADPSIRPRKGCSLRIPRRPICRRASSMCVNISSTRRCTVRTTSISTRSRISRSWKHSMCR